MTHNEMLDLIDSIYLVFDILDDSGKVAQWFTTHNPHFGEIKPIDMFLLGRGHKVLSFIKNAKGGDWP